MSDTDHTSDLTSEDWRMNAYYYGFDRTGQVVIDRILSAVAHAGKGYHHTEFWTDHLDYGAPSHLRGDSYAECIQNAAIDAADTLRIAEARATAAEVASRGYWERAGKAERAAQLLGKVVEDQCRDIVEITRSEHLVSPDGDADWGLIWERAYDLSARAEKAEAERDALADRAEKAEAKAARFAGLLGHQADAWDEGAATALAYAVYGPDGGLQLAVNPYRAATPPTTTREKENTR